MDRAQFLTQKLSKQGYVFPKLRSSLQTFDSRHHHRVYRYRIVISQMTLELFPLLRIFFIIFITDNTFTRICCLFVLFIYFSDVIFVSCDCTRFILVGFVLYILSYYCLSVLNPCNGVRYNFRKVFTVWLVFISVIGSKVHILL